MRTFITEVLSQRHQVFAVENGIEALSFLSDTDPSIQLIVSDVMMPEMDGFTLLRKLKTHDEYYRIPVVMLTALASERDKMTALTTGVDDYLTKPFSVAELQVRIQNLLYNYYQREKWIEERRKIVEQQKEIEEMPQSTQETILPSKPKGNWVQEVESQIVHHIKKELEINREVLASEIGVSLRQLNRQLKDSTGLSATQFIREVKLQWARERLEARKVTTIAQLAYQCGYQTPETFSRHYKQNFGKLPSEYLK